MVQAIDKLVRDWKKRFVFQKVKISTFQKKEGVYRQKVASLKGGLLINLEKQSLSPGIFITDKLNKECFSVLVQDPTYPEPFYFVRKKDIVTKEVKAMRLSILGETIIDTEKGIDKLSSLPFQLESLRLKYPQIF